jgi:hypothetical protein
VLALEKWQMSHFEFIETGPGAIITGLVGGIVFGAAGYFGADWVADHIDKN